MKMPIIIKRTSEQFAIGLKYEAPDIEEGARITSASVSISPSEIGGLEKDGSPVVEADTVSQMIKGGANGHEYYVKFTTVTSIGHIYEDAVFVKVRDI